MNGKFGVGFKEKAARKCTQLFGNIVKRSIPGSLIVGCANARRIAVSDVSVNGVLAVDVNRLLSFSTVIAVADRVNLRAGGRQVDFRASQ